MASTTIHSILWSVEQERLAGDDLSSIFRRLRRVPYDRLTQLHCASVPRISLRSFWNPRWSSAVLKTGQSRIPLFFLRTSNLPAEFYTAYDFIFDLCSGVQKMWARPV